MATKKKSAAKKLKKRKAFVKISKPESILFGKKLKVGKIDPNDPKVKALILYARKRQLALQKSMRPISRKTLDLQVTI